jgi:hypothetical protein
MSLQAVTLTDGVPFILGQSQLVFSYGCIMRTVRATWKNGLLWTKSSITKIPKFQVSTESLHGRMEEEEKPADAFV